MVKEFLRKEEIEFQTTEEGTASYTSQAKKKSISKEKKILYDLDAAIDFVNNYKQGKAKAKSLNQLLNEL
jgi:hypothetical protein